MTPFKSQEPARSRGGFQASFAAICFWTRAVALAFALAAASAPGQPEPPSLKLLGPDADSNLVFQTGTQAGYLYSLLQSTDLVNWSYGGIYTQYVGGQPLFWTNALSLSSPQRFYRVAANGTNTTVLTNYHSWTNVISLNNGVIEALIIPSTGRLQQLRFFKDTRITLWENSAMYGKPATNTASGNYDNFGGDKAWPSPQAVWNWPPPKGFDGRTNAASFTNGVVTMTTTLDTNYQIITTRIFEMLYNEPVLRVHTLFQRVASVTGGQTNLGVWIDCQALTTGSSKCYVPVPTNSIFTNGWTTNGSSMYTGVLPNGFTNINGLISFKPETVSHKVGFDSATLVMVGSGVSLRVDGPARDSAASYPDGNCSSEVYTASGYFELELLGPMSTMKAGDSIEFDTTYTLILRTEPTTDLEAKKILSWKY